MPNGLFTLKQQVLAIREGGWPGQPPTSVNYLVVAGGGGAGRTANGSGGGGGGGLLQGNIFITPGTSYTVTVGSGGSGGTSAGSPGSTGSNSVFGSITASGGGGGASGSTSSTLGNATSGGSGGGATGGGLNGVGSTPAQGTSGQGNAGGTASTGTGAVGSGNQGGGGGGAGTAGLPGTNQIAGNGGAGVASDISGTRTMYAGGGAGGINAGTGGSGGAGGGGGTGSPVDSAGIAGAVNTGGGGGGGNASGANQNGGAGGSGIVIVSYPGSTQWFTGGVVNYYNGNVVHTFTQSGTLAPAAPTQLSTTFQVSRSLRFNSADSAYLNRTYSSTPTDLKRQTFSFWVKRGTLGGVQRSFVGGYNGTAGASTYVGFGSDDTLRFVWDGSSAQNLISTSVYRDPSAWYHIVAVADSTQATASERLKLFVNGVQVTSFSTANYPPQNSTSQFSLNNGNNAVGSGWGGSDLFNGYMTDINFIDGQALTPSFFAQTNADTGAWEPKPYSGAYGTNGFYLNFSDNSNTTAATLGKDYSGNGNNWTPNNFSVSAGAGNDSLVDTPTPYGVDTGAGGNVRGNYCTLNPLNAKLGTGSLTNGNLAFTGPSGLSAYNFVGGTFAITTDTTTGFYFEVTQSTYGQFGAVSLLDIGVYASALNTNDQIGFGNNATAGVGYRNDGVTYNYGTSASGLTSWSSNGDVIGVAIKDNKVWFAKNGTWISGNPATGTSPSITLASTKTVTPAGTGINSCVFDYNFGQRPFAYTAPSGFKALCTQNLPTPTIGATSTTQAGKYFNPVLYTGNGSAQVVSGFGFQPDLVWLKSRSTGGYDNWLFDAVRGAGLIISSNSTGAEINDSTKIPNFTSDGFNIANTGTTFNGNGSTFVSWGWKANGAGSSNTAGSITSTVSANTTSGFSIVTWATSGNQTVGHGLGVAPSMVIAKARGAVDDWYVYHASIGATKYLRLNNTGAEATSSGVWQNTAPTSTVFSVGSGINGGNMVAYCFAEVPGYSKFGSYTGNGSTDGPFVFCGFRPAYVMLKNASNAYSGDSSWWIHDDVRRDYNPQGPMLASNLSNAEVTFTQLDMLSNGFKLRTNSNAYNINGDTYIFVAFAEFPQKFALAR